MTALADAIAACAAIADGYRAQLALLAAAEPDLDRIGTIAADIDRRCAALPAPAALAGTAAEREQWHGALVAADALRQEAAAALAAARQRLIAGAADDHRGGDAVRAYGQAGDDAARFVDRRG